MADFKLDLEEIDRDVVLVKRTYAGNVRVEQLPEKLAALTARIRDLERENAGLMKAEMTEELDAQNALQVSLFDAIAHGDEDHRAWLREAITAHFAGKPVPTLRGDGRKDALLEEARELLELVALSCTSWDLGERARNQLAKMEALKP